jgi:hypothetical protein
MIRSLRDMLQFAIDAGVNEQDDAWQRVNGVLQAWDQIVEMEAKLEKLDGTRPAVDVTELGRVLDEADRFGLPRPSMTLFRSHLNEIKELSEKLAGIMDAEVLNPTLLREVLIKGKRSGVSLELQARAKEMGERHIAADHQLRMALVEPGNTVELEAAINEAVRFGVPEEKVAPARTSLMTVTAMHAELTALLEPEEGTLPLEPKVLGEAVLRARNLKASAALLGKAEDKLAQMLDAIRKSLTEALTARPLDLDTLQRCIDEASKAGIEVHAVQSAKEVLKAVQEKTGEVSQLVNAFHSGAEHVVETLVVNKLIKEARQMGVAEAVIEGAEAELANFSKSRDELKAAITVPLDVTRLRDAIDAVQNISIDKELRAVATAALERATTVLANVTRLAEERPLEKSELDSQLAEARAMLAPEPLKDVEAVRAELREAENVLALALSTPIETLMETDALMEAIARSVAAGVSKPDVSAASRRLDLAVAAIASLQAAIAAETHASEALIAALEEAKAAHIYGELVERCAAKLAATREGKGAELTAEYVRAAGAAAAEAAAVGLKESDDDNTAAFHNDVNAAASLAGDFDADFDGDDDDAAAILSATACTPSSFAACAPTFAGGGMALGPAPAGPACEMRLFSWAQCEKCSKWRRLPPGREPSEDAYWECSMNPKRSHNTCEATQEEMAENELAGEELEAVKRQRAAAAATSASAAAGGGADGGEKKQRFVWSKEVHQHFCKAVQNVGIEHAKPREIADQMALLLPDAPSRPSSRLISRRLQKYKQLHASPSYAGSNLKDAYAATNTTTAPDHPTTSVYAAQSTTAVFKVGDVVRCTISPTAVCRKRSIFKVTHDGKTAGDGCGDGQFIIQLVKPHNKCIIDPSHLMTFKVNGSNLVGPLPPDIVISNYAEMGSHNEFVQPDEDTVTRSQLDNMLMTNPLMMPPSFPELPSPFHLFKVTKSMGLQGAANYVYHNRGAQNWVHHQLHYVLLAFWLWDRSPDGRTTTGLLTDPILLIKNGITGSYGTTSDHRMIARPASALNTAGWAYVGPT